MKEKVFKRKGVLSVQGPDCEGTVIITGPSTHGLLVDFDPKSGIMASWAIDANGRFVRPDEQSHEFAEPGGLSRRNKYVNLPPGTLIVSWQRHGRHATDRFVLETVCDDYETRRLADDPSNFQRDLEVPTIDFSESQVATLVYMDSAIADTLQSIGLKVTGNWTELVKKALGVRRRLLLL